VVYVFVAVEGYEGAGKEFGNHLASREAGEDVTVAVFENKNSFQRSALGKSEMGFAMPRRAIHVDLSRVC